MATALQTVVRGQLRRAYAQRARVPRAMRSSVTMDDSQF
jgi:hypothetical protein